MDRLGHRPRAAPWSRTLTGAPAAAAFVADQRHGVASLVMAGRAGRLGGTVADGGDGSMADRD
jgi:hypothetical protein